MDNGHGFIAKQCEFPVTSLSQRGAGGVVGATSVQPGQIASWSSDGDRARARMLSGAVGDSECLRIFLIFHGSKFQMVRD